MTKSVVNVPDGAASATREIRPFLFLEPARGADAGVAPDPLGLDQLDAMVGDDAAALARSLVQFSIELQNRSMLERGDRQPIRLSVLNRRRRAARAWVNAVLAGRVDEATRHAVCTQWVPLLAATGPDLRPSVALGRKFVEFLRGAITGRIFVEPAESLLPHARALHAAEAVLGTHLAALERAVRPTPSAR